VTASVLALLDDAGVARDIAASFEEEGVPLTTEEATGLPLELARGAARRSSFGIGVGGADGHLVAVLAASPGRPYLEATARDARDFGRDVARVIARRPLVRGNGAGRGRRPPRPWRMA
jgi:hypothetical protein